MGSMPINIWLPRQVVSYCPSMFWNIYLPLYYEISITLLIRYDFLGAYYIHFLLKWLLLNPTPFPMFFSVWLVLFIYKEWKRVHMNDFITMTTGFVEELELPESKPRVATYESFYNQDGQYPPTNWYYSWFVNSELFYNCMSFYDSQCFHYYTMLSSMLLFLQNLLRIKMTCIAVV